MKLRIYEVSVADAGVYVLEAANADMTTSESVTLAVTGKSQPHRCQHYHFRTGNQAFSSAITVSPFSVKMFRVSH